jgi:CarboxypepD_reg-like domain/TonB dependent receptor
MLKKLLFFFLNVALPAVVLAQVTLKGVVVDQDNQKPLADVAVSINGTAIVAATDANGAFVLSNVPDGRQTLVVTKAAYLTLEKRVTVLKAHGSEQTVNITLLHDPNVVEVSVPSSGSNTTGDIPTVTLDEAESETEGQGEVANLLHSSRDVFQALSGFGWSVFRFRERGYESENFPLFLNGVQINDPETGIAFFGEFGGLNDVLRARTSTIGLEASEFAFTEVGGATNLDTRASVQRGQIRASYSISNRTYRHRVMLTASTGLMPNGWAVTASLSRRWAQEGWFEGTPFDANSYFLSVDKKIGRRHNFNVMVLGAPTKRGRQGDTFQEMIDLAGTTRYNPLWGYWNGEKRNSSIAYSNQPIVMARWDWNPSDNTGFTWSTYGQAGRRGSTRLDWFNASNPSPDFNRRLPSSLGDSLATAQWADQLRNNQSLRQIDWAGIWEANAASNVTVQGVNGDPEATLTGRQSSVVVADFREDSRELGTNLVFRHQANDRLTFNGGANFQYYLGRNFKTVDDILGGEFILDINPFAQRDLGENTLALNNDIRTPNRVVREGDTYGWDYNENIRKANTWVQGQYNLSRFQLFAAGQYGFTQLWRTGFMQNGRFPDNSLGDSEKANFNTWGVKTGVVFKFNGRNYVYGNGYKGTRAPLFRDIFLSPRTRHDFYDADPYKITGWEGGFIHRSPQLKLRATYYWTQFADQVESFLLFGQVTNAFGTEIRTNVDEIHSGFELGFEYRPFSSWVFSGATNLGYYRYTSRPSITFYEDNTNLISLDNKLVYQNNFLVPRTPQTTASASIKYEGRRFWFAALTANFADDLWFEFDRARRTEEYAIQLNGAGAGPGTAVWNEVLDQTKAPAAFTLDLFVGKSWRIKENYFVYFNAGLNNLLDNRNILQSGREVYYRAFRDVDNLNQYSNELQYAPGFNYFISATLRI